MREREEEREKRGGRVIKIGIQRKTTQQKREIERECVCVGGGGRVRGGAF